MDQINPPSVPPQHFNTLPTSLTQAIPPTSNLQIPVPNKAKAGFGFLAVINFLSALVLIVYGSVTSINILSLKPFEVFFIGVPCVLLGFRLLKLRTALRNREEWALKTYTVIAISNIINLFVTSILSMITQYEVVPKITFGQVAFWLGVFLGELLLLGLTIYLKPYTVSIQNDKLKKTILILFIVYLLGSQTSTVMTMVKYKTFEHVFSSKSSPCTLIPDPGSCKANFPSYYFDRISQNCRQFSWGGCDGVRPFKTLIECQSACVQN